MKPIAYEGTEPYIFVSYAHRDSDSVLEVLSELERHGYRLWYDDGIAPGSEWPEDIAQHLDAAAVVMAFVTNNSMASRNCRREINFSLSREKPFLSILMEPTEMPLGMEMQLSAQQSIVRYNYNSWEGFVAKILSARDIQPCKQSAPTPPARAAEPEVQPRPERPSSGVGHAVPVAAPPAAQEVEAVVEVVPREGEAPARALPAPRRAKKAEETAAENKPAGGRSKLILAIAAAALVMVAAVAVFALSGGTGTVTLSTGEEIRRDAGLLTLRDQTLSAEDWATIASLAEAPDGPSSLYFENCDLSACDFAGTTDALQGVGTLSFAASTGVDYRFLGKVPVAVLSVTDDAGFTDLSVLDVASLRSLDVSRTGVTDLSPLAGSSITDLTFAETGVKSVDALAQMPELAQVDGSSTKVSSLEPLAGLPNLRKLVFDQCQIDQLPASLAALELSEVRLAGNALAEAGGLSACTRLKVLDLSGNADLSDLSWLDAQNGKTLEELRLSQTALGEDDLAWLGQCVALRELYLDGIELSGLSACASMPELKTLSAVNCGLEDLAGLENCTNLQVALLAFNKISDLAPLRTMTHDVSRTTVDLSYNALQSAEGLAPGDYYALLLYGNDAHVAETIPAGVEGYELVAPWSEGLLEGTFASDAPFTKLYLLGCPDNQVLNTIDVLGESRTSLVSESELWKLYAEDGFYFELEQDYGYFLSLVGA